MMTIMKLKYIISAIAIVALSSSCQDFLNLSDPDKVTVGNYYQTETDLEQSLFGAYAKMKDTYAFGTGCVYFEECKANTLFYPDTGVNAGENSSFDNCTVVSTNQFVASRWNSLYGTIDRANVVLKHLDDVKFANENTKKSFEAEARFIRAICYYALVTDFGAVPLVLSKLGTLGEVNAANVRVDKDKVYQAIFDDCKVVVESPLPDLQSAANCGRASKVAALTLWGKAALQMATDPDFSAQKATLCQTAITELEAAWSKKGFSALKDLPIEDAFNVDSQAGAKENIFQLSYVSGSTSANSSYNTQFRPVNIDDPAKEVNAKKSAGGFFMKETLAPTIWDEAGDARFDKLIGHGVSNSVPYWYTVKYKDLNSSGYYGCNRIIYRYADVVLMLAEAYYHKGDAATAQKYVNMVRERAGLKATSATGTALRDVIYKERDREFAYEFMNWSDWKRGFTKDEIKAKMNARNATEYSETDLLLPIPHAQWLLNPEGLKQNPGYND